MGDVSIRIPLSAILAGNYKVGLTPRDRLEKLEARTDPDGIRCSCGAGRGVKCRTCKAGNHAACECENKCDRSMVKKVAWFEKTAVSLPELVQQTNQFSVKNRPGCTPALTKSSPKDLFLQYQVTCHLKDSDPRGHEVKVQFDISKIQESQKATDLDVQCSCSCPAFLYWGAQWNLSQKDGLLGEPRPLLQAPTQRLDLRSNFVICKHCKAVFERILPSVQNNINTILRKKEVEKKEKEQEGKPKPTIRRQPGKKPTAPEEHEEQKEEILEEQDVVTREEPATHGEREKEKTHAPAPAEKKKIPTGPKGEEAMVPTPEKPELTPAEERAIKQQLVKEEAPKLQKEHPHKPHVDTGLPYEPRWKKWLNKMKERVKSWGKKFKGE